ncbi:hypothetical protein [Gracilimonas mengyeensis]|uniref:GDSL-like Lipase/Acylhydrolase n=1 Tax=Gracilimonas mengyeensis TaxID=1302730 RepID=A0A521F3S4_9BACT|nr:hypothetical protein [Gracilimonas mengyeensis]SMO90827.1 GDSL-like Lipase/Acylhydrolase [Gracilimonas mengyeensis]
MFWNKKEAKHKLVVIGDSLSQGFNNGGIYRTDINFPALLHRCFEPKPRFDQPSFTAQTGIPLNLEMLVRGLSEEFGDEVNWKELLPAAGYTVKTLKRIKKYWEGGLKDLSVERDTPFHNQSVWGFNISDSWVVNERNSREHIQNNPERFTVFDMLPEHAKFTTARLVLNPPLKEELETRSQIDNAQALADDGGIDNLIVCLGHNNMIAAITDLKIIWTEDDNLEVFPGQRKHTVYRPEHFEQQYRKLAHKISALGAKRVFVPTLPYVTIPPVIRGVNSDLSEKHEGYFDYYTRFWIWDEDFDPEKHAFLTKEQAMELDATMDEYNHIIKKVADEYGWHVVPMAKNVAGLARRRLGGELVRDLPRGLAKALKNKESTAHLVDENGEVHLTTDYLRLDENKKIYKGGIFSLDGLHPTTIGYGLMANVYLKTMARAGVDFEHPINWDEVVSEDSLISNPPKLLSELRHVLRFLAMGHQERFFKIGKNVLGQAMEMVSPRQTD